MRKLTYEDLQSKIRNAYKNNTANRSFLTGVFNGNQGVLFDGIMDYGYNAIKESRRSIGNGYGDGEDIPVSSYENDIYNHGEDMIDRLRKLQRIFVT